MIGLHPVQAGGRRYQPGGGPPALGPRAPQPAGLRPRGRPRPDAGRRPGRLRAARPHQRPRQQLAQQRRHHVQPHPRRRLRCDALLPQWRSAATSVLRRRWHCNYCSLCRQLSAQRCSSAWGCLLAIGSSMHMPSSHRDRCIPPSAVTRPCTIWRPNRDTTRRRGRGAAGPVGGGAHLRGAAGKRAVGGGRAAGAVQPRRLHRLHPHAQGGLCHQFCALTAALRAMPGAIVTKIKLQHQCCVSG